MLLPVAWRATITLLRVGLVQGRWTTISACVLDTNIVWGPGRVVASIEPGGNNISAIGCS